MEHGFEVWKLIGWTGNALFFGRFLIQWLATERAGRIMVPAIFWHLSIVGALMNGAYSVAENSLIFAASPAVNLFIYARNLNIRRHGKGLDRGAFFALGLGLLALVVTAFFVRDDQKHSSLLWVLIGATGATLWLARFPLQWIHAERHAEATFPRSFFLVSFLGAVLLLAFAIEQRNAIWIAGYALGPVMYGRQLFIACRRQTAAPVPYQNAKAMEAS